MKPQPTVWLYGSVARGDAEASSDVDILLLGEGEVPKDVSRHYSGRRLSLSRYSWEELRQMAAYGSLFLHHLKTEGRPLSESPRAARDLRDILVGLPNYRRVGRDVCAFRQSLNDIAAELPEPTFLRFELATLAALIRRIGILGSYLLGRPRFDRVGPVEQVVDAWGLPSGLSREFPQLYLHRQVADGAPSVTAEASPDMLALWTERAHLFLAGLEVQANEAS